MTQVEGTTLIQDLLVTVGVPFGFLALSIAWMQLVNGKIDPYQLDFIIKAATTIFALFLVGLLATEFDKFEAFAKEHVPSSVLLGLLALGIIVGGFKFDTERLQH